MELQNKMARAPQNNVSKVSVVLLKFITNLCGAEIA